MKQSYVTIAVLISAGWATCAAAQQEAPKAPAPTDQPAAAAVLPDSLAKISYCLGLNIGTGLRNQGIRPNVNAMAMGIADAMAGRKPKLTPEEIQASMQLFQKELQAQMAKIAQKNKEAGDAFLAENKTKQGVITRDSGLQYTVIKEGDGPSPKATDVATVNYIGTLINGKEFDNSHKRGKPQQVLVNGVIKGWSEALQLMKVGSKWKLFIPTELAYSMNPRPGSPIPAGAALIFEVELLSIQSQPKAK